MQQNETAAAKAFANFESQEVNFLPFQKFELGWHDATVKMAILTSDIYTGLRTPTLKKADKMPVWKDATPQLAVYFEGENHVGETRRFPARGYKKFDVLLAQNPEKAAQCTKEGAQGYAVTKDTRVRIIDQEATEASQMIINRMLTAAGVPAGITGGEKICEALVGKKLKIQITAHQFQGKDYTDVQNFVSIDTPVAELSRVPVPKNVVTVIPETQDEE